MRRWQRKGNCAHIYDYRDRKDSVTMATCSLSARISPPSCPNAAAVYLCVSSFSCVHFSLHAHAHRRLYSASPFNSRRIFLSSTSVAAPAFTHCHGGCCHRCRSSLIRPNFETTMPPLSTLRRGHASAVFPGRGIGGFG